MYYQLLHYKIDTLNHYNVYLDIKDTLSARKVRNLRNILNVQFGIFRNVQNIASKESLLMQLSDFIMGAISYNANMIEQENPAKIKIIERIKRHANVDDLKKSNYSEKFKFILHQFKIEAMPLNLLKKL